MRFTNCHPELVEGVMIIRIIELRQAQFDKRNILFDSLFFISTPKRYLTQPRNITPIQIVKSHSSSHFIFTQLLILY